MSGDPDPEAQAQRDAARRRLMGRAVVVGLLTLVALYVFATFRPH